jgi:hypothetical protein
MSKGIPKEDQPFFAYYDSIIIDGNNIVIYCGKGTEVRSNNNRKQLRNNKYNRIITKYGKPTRTRVECLDQDLALKLEDWFIQYYHTWIDDPLASEYACNIEGPGTTSKTKSTSEETRAKLRVIRAKQIITDEHRKNQSIAAYNRPKQPKKPKPLIPVYRIDIVTGEIIDVFNSTQEASQLLNIYEAGIIACCKRSYTYVHGYVWRYVHENLSKEDIKNEVKFLAFKKKLHVLKGRLNRISTIKNKTNKTYII